MNKAFFPDILYSMAHKLNPSLGKLYLRFWNPINYAIIGGTGVLINYAVFAILIPSFPWWYTNAIAIAVAWFFNWINSVGPLGYLWGFRKRGGD